MTHSFPIPEEKLTDDERAVLVKAAAFFDQLGHTYDLPLGLHYSGDGRVWRALRSVDIVCLKCDDWITYSEYDASVKDDNKIHSGDAPIWTPFLNIEPPSPEDVAMMAPIEIDYNRPCFLGLSR